MTRQQAGVSAEAVAAIRWYLDAIFWASKHECAPAEDWQCNFCDGFRAHKPGCEYVIATDALNTLLAAAPPEQAALEYANELIDDLLNNEHCSCLKGPSQHPCPRCSVTIEEARNYMATCTVPDPPQPVSDGALDELVAKWRKRVEYHSEMGEAGEHLAVGEAGCADELEAALASGAEEKETPRFIGNQGGMRHKEDE